MNVVYFIAGLLGIFLIIIPILLCVFDRYNGTDYSCKYIGWHNGDGEAEIFDGCSVHAKCSKCHKNVMQDGQGNWF